MIAAPMGDNREDAKWRQKGLCDEFHRFRTLVRKREVPCDSFSDVQSTLKILLIYFIIIYELNVTLNMCIHVADITNQFMYSIK